MAQYGQEKLRQPTLHWECDSDRVNLHRTFSLPRIDEKNKNPRPYQGSCEKESKRDVCRIGKQLIFFLFPIAGTYIDLLFKKPKQACGIMG